MAITTRNIDVYLRGIRADFAEVVDQAQKQIGAYETNVYLDSTNKVGGLFAENDRSGQQRVEYLGTTGVSRLLPTNELAAFPQTTYQSTYLTQAEPFKFARRIVVSRESVERRDNQYNKALEEASKLQYAYINTRASNKFDRFNQAFAAVTASHLFDYGDVDAGATALVANNHPDKVGNTHSNLVGPSAITPVSIEAMVLALQNQVDDIGEPMPMGGGTKFMVVPPALVRLAKQNLETELEPFTANNQINVWYGAGWTVVSSAHLSAAHGGSNTAWFVLDGQNSPLVEEIFKPITAETWFDDDRKAFVHDVEFNHKVGAKDYRGIVGNQGI